MRFAIASLFFAAAALSAPAAARDVVKFDGVQEHCMRVAGIKFGTNSRWPTCSVTKGRWFATVGIIDLYQAQYCLGRDGESCDRRALLVFANRAYTPKAQLLMHRTDPGNAEYDDPLLVQTQYGDLLALTARTPDGASRGSYYLWRSGRWVPVEAQGWLRGLAKHLPEGESVAGAAAPDIDSMTAQVTLAGAGDRVAEVELGLVGDRFTVKNVKVAQKPQ